MADECFLTGFDAELNVGARGRKARRLHARRIPPADLERLVAFLQAGAGG